jgi:hypothetical protein
MLLGERSFGVRAAMLGGPPHARRKSNAAVSVAFLRTIRMMYPNARAA